MEDYYKKTKHLVAVDCVIFGYKKEQLHLLLYPRGFEPAKGKWSLMGGFLQDKESSDDSARRILKSTTGLMDVYLEQVAFFTNPLRDKAARVISLVYYALLKEDKYDETLVREHGAHWWPVNKLPDFIFDHEEMVRKSMEKLQLKASINLVGIELLPEMFTLQQLRNLYEAIFQKKLDPGNFRKKLLSTDMFEKLNIKNTKASKKGAYYYRVKVTSQNKSFDRLMKF
ncbi:NUDIX domain-containing protein [Maribacter sp.]|uniref:NUDIX hydrolase n=1 Tax=Maribacter sp. TaxID=1897614 RepID=UPI0025BDE426|nr:NUDIX domain-containing protein [Maribacter sp.]